VQQALAVRRPPRAGRRSQKERLFEALRQEILALGLKPGQVIVEAEIARRFRVSKTPVREALALLQQHGLVAALARRGYLVTTVTVTDLHDMFEVRVALEGAAAELAASRMTAEELAQLEALTRPPQELLRRVAGHPDRKTMQALLDYNRRFHLTIARASRNERLARLVERSLDEMMRPIAIGYPADEHGEIVAAFRTGDPARARAAVVEHILMTQERVLKREGLRS
jgi:DNA-binding GntR family transcriptional regulator